MENKNFISKTISFLEKGDDTTVSNQKEILKEVYIFFETLYSHKEIEDIELDQWIFNAPKLSPDEAGLLEGKITVQEAGSVLKDMKNSKSADHDGFNPEFYKLFFFFLLILAVFWFTL